MPEAERKEAVGQFTGSEACRVFVLHAGQAAAGLTLTVARTVFLLEPFLSAGSNLAQHPANYGRMCPMIQSSRLGWTPCYIRQVACQRASALLGKLTRWVLSAPNNQP
jgi:hypothetical protein